MFDKGPIGGLEQAAQFARKRQEVISQNIANVETPDYRTKELPVTEFEDALNDAFQRMEDRNVRVFKMDESDDVVRNSSSSLITPREARGEQAGILRHDRNNVSIDREMSKLSQNRMFHENTMNFLRHKFDLIEQAITEQAGG